MTASKAAWAAVLGGTLLLLSIAAAGLGVLPAFAGHSAPSIPAGHVTAVSGNNSSTTYPVTFSESGLPNGTFWYVSVHGAWVPWYGPEHFGPHGPFWGHGSGSNGSTNQTIGFAVANGTYDFFVSGAHSNGTLYTPTASIGNFTVNGSAVAVNVTFALATFYNVSFVESGLPNGTFWAVVLHGSDRGGWGHAGEGARADCGGGSGWSGSNTSSINFTLPDGTYRFAVPAAWTSSGLLFANPQSGTVTVNGSSVTESITFAPPQLYNVTFNETGLPNGTTWSAAVVGGGWGSFGFNSSANSTIGFVIGDGTYRYGVLPVWTSGGIYVATPATGNLTVNGSAVSVSVAFALVPTYNVTFVETGLPNGTSWSAGLFGSGWGHAAWNSTSNGSLTLTVPDGAYHFLVAPVFNSTGYFSASPAFGNVTVNGTSVTVDVSFSFSNYSSAWAPSNSDRASSHVGLSGSVLARSA